MLGNNQTKIAHFAQKRIFWEVFTKLIFICLLSHIILQNFLKNVRGDLNMKACIGFFPFGLKVDFKQNFN